MNTNVVLKNTGDTPSDGTDLRITFPQNGFFVGIDELPGLKRDGLEPPFRESEVACGAIIAVCMNAPLWDILSPDKLEFEY